jgi:hypothetical protein
LNWAIPASRRAISKLVSCCLWTPMPRVKNILRGISRILFASFSHGLRPGIGGRADRLPAARSARIITQNGRSAGKGEWVRAFQCSNKHRLIIKTNAAVGRGARKSFAWGGRY